MASTPCSGRSRTASTSQSTPSACSRFRLAGEASVVDGHTRGLVAALAADGHAYISSTEVHGRIALRLCTDNPRTTFADVEGTIARLGELAAEPALV
jgi:hypothetical protein